MGPRRKAQLLGTVVPALAASAYIHAESSPGSLQATVAVACGVALGWLLLKGESPAGTGSAKPDSKRAQGSTIRRRHGRRGSAS
ncbi:hypothetical protein GCM10028796_23190 [Ramlibacter monticola]